VGLTLVIGTKRFSSWSLRPWIALRQAGVPFEERCVRLRQPDTRAKILDYSPSGKVPILFDDDLAIWDSLAILEYAAERFPEARLWPEEPKARARARSISAEMHAGFAAVRSELPMDACATLPTPDLSAVALQECARIQEIWRDARTGFGAAGPFLFGAFTNADAMYAPVATRFRTYAIALDPICRAYADAVLALPAMASWYDEAARQSYSEISA
jgi:glutathione S-transferase